MGNVAFGNLLDDSGPQVFRRVSEHASITKAPLGELRYSRQQIVVPAKQSASLDRKKI
jgi:hypothetical protein